MPLPFIPVPNVAEVVFQGSFDPGDAFITMSFQRDTPFDVAGLNDLLNHINTWWDTELSGQVTANWKMPTFKATALDSADAPSVIRINDGQLQGQLFADGLPDNAAMSVTFITESRGRSFRGRNFVPHPPAVAKANNSQWATVPVADMTLAYEALPLLLDEFDITHVVVSRYHDGERRETGVATPVTAYRANSKIATMRGRIVGTGS